MSTQTKCKPLQEVRVFRAPRFWAFPFLVDIELARDSIYNGGDEQWFMPRSSGGQGEGEEGE